MLLGRASTGKLCGRQEQPFVNRVCMKFEYIMKVHISYTYSNPGGPVVPQCHIKIHINLWKSCTNLNGRRQRPERSQDERAHDHDEDDEEDADGDGVGVVLHVGAEPLQDLLRHVLLQVFEDVDVHRHLLEPQRRRGEVGFSDLGAIILLYLAPHHLCRAKLCAQYISKNSPKIIPEWQPGSLQKLFIITRYHCLARDIMLLWWSSPLVKTLTLWNIHKKFSWNVIVKTR